MSAVFIRAYSIATITPRNDARHLTGDNRGNVLALERGTLDSMWIEKGADDSKTLAITATFAKRTDWTGSCSQTRLVARVDSGRTVTFPFPLPKGRDGVEITLGRKRDPTMKLRIDLLRETVEREGVAWPTHQRALGSGTNRKSPDDHRGPELRVDRADEALRVAR
jgi:hypothetical protein